MDKITEIKHLFSIGKIGRREFVQGAATLGLSAATAATFINDVKAATPKSGGHVKAGCAGGQTADSMDVATWVNSMQMVTGITINEYLTETDADENLIPRFAEGWEAADGGKTWIFNLRKGVEHSNGKTIDAHDVIGSLNYHLGEESKSSFKPQLAQISSMRAEGNFTVVFELSSANADFPVMTSDYRAAILPCKDGKPMVVDGSISGGSYLLETFEPGVRSIMKRNPNYWNSDVGHFDSIEWLSLRDDNARQTALITGDVDVIQQCNLGTVDRLQALENINVLSAEGKQHFTFPMRTDMAPFDNNDVRMAMKLSFEREEFLQKILRGYGSIGNDQPISRAYRYYDADIPQRVYDPDKAKWHLKQAGLESLDVQLFASDTGFLGSPEAAALYAERAKKAGINIDIVRAPADGYWNEVWMKKPFCACQWFGRPVADEMLALTYAAGGSWNDTFWNHERFNKILIEARSELDQAKRAEMYSELQLIIRDEGGQLIPGFAHWVDAASTKIGTPAKLSGRNSVDGFRFGERWWFSA